MTLRVRGHRNVEIDGLSSVRPDLRRKLLDRHQESLQEAGVLKDAKVKYGRLAQLLEEHSPLIPTALIGDLTILSRLRHDRSFDVLSRHASQLGVLPEGPSTADLAALVIMHAPELAERICAETLDVDKRAFTQVAAVDRDDLPSPDLSDVALEELEHALRRDFLSKYGSGTRVYRVDEPAGFRLVIRRGEIPRRVRTINQQDDSTLHVAFRLEAFDVVRFDSASKQLSVAAKGTKLCRAYIQLVGKHLFGHLRAFDETGANCAFTFKPLRSLGECLKWRDVPGLAGVDLTGLDWEQGFSDPITVTYRHEDLGGALEALDLHLPDDAHVIRARFRVRFDNGNRTVVVLKEPNYISYGAHDEEPTIRDWLRKRGFAPDRTRVRPALDRPLPSAS